MLIKIILQDKFFCNGKSFDQLIGVEPTREAAIEHVAKLIDRDPKLKHYSIVFEEFDKPWKL